MTVPLLFWTALIFFQTTFLSVDLVFLALAISSFVVYRRSNYYLAFALGLVVSLLTGQHLGVLSLIYLFGVKTAHFLQKTALSSYWLSIIPVSLLLLFIEYTIDIYLLNLDQEWRWVLLQTAISPIFYLLFVIWEDRSISKKEIKLKTS